MCEFEARAIKIKGERERDNIGRWLYKLCIDYM